MEFLFVSTFDTIHTNAFTTCAWKHAFLIFLFLPTAAMPSCSFWLITSVFNPFLLAFACISLKHTNWT